MIAEKARTRRPPPTVELADGETYDIRFDHRALVTIETWLRETYQGRPRYNAAGEQIGVGGSWSRLVEAFDYRYHELVALMVGLAINKPKEEAYDLILGVRQRTLIDALLDAISDAMPMTKEQAVNGRQGGPIWLWW